tara:strand:+ start:3672 stop:4676 length:1005 start_codon:yes stop_codon:yes gene_type:complete
MIKILYLFTNKHSASFIFYKNSLKKEKSFNINFLTKLPNNYREYDFIFLQSGFNKVKNFKKFNNDVKIVLVEPRLGHDNDLKLKFDLVIFNSIESQIFFSNKIEYLEDIIYPTFPEYVVRKMNRFKKKNEIVITYHGNKVHLENFKKIIWNAVKNLSYVFKDKKIKVNLIYNIKNLGISKNVSSNKNISISHVQYSESNIRNILSKTDIGLVPQTIQRKNIFKILYKKGSNNFDLIFKESTNLGRHLVFGQFQIPVITEPTPSVIKFFDRKSIQYIAYDKETWSNILIKLISNYKLRTDLGSRLHKVWFKNFKHHILNKKLSICLKKIKKYNDN